MSAKRTVLVTGSSQGGLGDSLARALHTTGHFRVFASGRNPSKIAHFKSLGIETVLLDVLSAESIAGCVKEISNLTGGRLDVLINNSGGGYSTPLTDVDLHEARKLFDLNFWAVLEVTNAFLPLILASEKGGVVVNNTSVVAVLNNPYGGIYNASKAAAAMLNDNMRVELAPFGVQVVDLKTGAVKSKFFKNMATAAASDGRSLLSAGSIYEPIREKVEQCMNGEHLKGAMMDADGWAKEVVASLSGRRPPVRIWKGESAFLVRVMTGTLPIWVTDYILAGMNGLDVLKKKIALHKTKKA